MDDTDAANYSSKISSYQHEKYIFDRIFVELFNVTAETQQKAVLLNRMNDSLTHIPSTRSKNRQNACTKLQL